MLKKNVSSGITGGIAFLCSFLLFSIPVEAMGHLFIDKFFIFNSRKSRATGTSFWDGPLRIQVNF